MIRVIIFDWHGVLDEVTFGGLLQKFSKLTRKNSLLVRFKIRKIAWPYIAGKITPDEFWSKVREILKLDEGQIREARNYVNRVELNESLWNTLPSLKKNTN